MDFQFLLFISGVEPIWDLVVGHLLEVFVLNLSLVIQLAVSSNKTKYSGALQLADAFSPQLRNLALDALDKSICAVLGSDQFQTNQNSEKQLINSDVRIVVIKHSCSIKLCVLTFLFIYFFQVKLNDFQLGSFECAVLSPLMILYKSSQNIDVRTGSLKILLHVLEVPNVSQAATFVFPFECFFTFCSYVSYDLCLQRHGEKLCYSWACILDLLRLF